MKRKKVIGTQLPPKRSAAMPGKTTTIEHKALTLVDLHGAKARQKVVDEIVRAIRDHDIRAAKQWEKIGQTVDKLLTAEAASR